MTTGKTINGKSGVKDLHAQFEEGELASMTMPVRWFLVCNCRKVVSVFIVCLLVFSGSLLPIHANTFIDCFSGGSATFSYNGNSADNYQVSLSLDGPIAWVPSEIHWRYTKYYDYYGSTQSKVVDCSAQLKGIKKVSGNFTVLKIPKGVEEIGANALENLKNLEMVEFIGNSKISTLNDGLFYGCTSLASITIPDAVTNIGNQVFWSCESLSSITIPSAVQAVGKNVFKGCCNLASIAVGDDSRFFSSDDGALYDKNHELLVAVPGAMTEIVVPATVTHINPDAFAGCGKMKRMRIPYALAVSVDMTSIIAECAEDCVAMYYGPAETQMSPNPPMNKDDKMSITPTSRGFGVNGGGNAIVTAGSGNWTAAVSDPWITLNATSGNVGYPVAYTVSANTNVEQRTGYVYVSGWVHTITQDGVGGKILPEGAVFESDGGMGTLQVNVQNGMAWKSCPNAEWLSVETTSGVGDGMINYHVEPYDEVATRQGTLTVAGNTFTVFQYGRRMKLDSYSVTHNYGTHVIPITVNALAITQWSVTPNNSWISIVDGGNGQGGDLVTIAIAENPSYKARTGTVTIGTETFTVTQEGRPTEALEFAVSPVSSAASVEGANGMIAVTATPDLPWTATSEANWITVYAVTANGAGNGNVVYVASPNPTLYERTGTIRVTPEAESGMIAKTHTVTQPAAQSALSISGYEFEAAGESCSVDVSLANIVEWSIDESIDWLTVNGSNSRVGPGTVTLQAAANDTVYPRSGTVWIAGKAFSVTQKARGVELEYDTKLFGTDGGYESISIHPDGNVAWTAVASDPTWITIFQNDSGTGDAEIMYIVSPYVGDGSARTGWITVGDKRVYITQRAYDLSIEPNGTLVTGNNGAGEFGVSAGIGDVWTAIVTEPWITLVSGYDAGTGSGTVRFVYTENTTGKTRTGKIIVAGEVYTLEQRARQMVAITTTAEHGGHVSGGGSYDLGTQVELTAVPESGYAFSYWTGTEDSMVNPLIVTADVPKSYTAVFEPLPIAFTSVESSVDGVALAWNNLAWAATYRIYRGVTSVPSSATVLVELPNDGDCGYMDETGDVGVEYWYWIEAEGPSDDVMSDPMTGRKEKPVVFASIIYENLRGATNPNPDTYKEGTLVSFENPGAVDGYTFAGWMPNQITTEMTGEQVVYAAWTANSYSIVYNPGEGSGEMDATLCTYDKEGFVAANGFTYYGHIFAGWATEDGGEIVYEAGQSVTNLTAESNGVVTLYAVWEQLVVADPVITPDDGSVFTEDSCEVTIVCATEGATIYYSTNGTPRTTDKYKYTGPFAITDTATIKAIAVCEDKKSNYATVTITRRVITLADALGIGDGAVVTTGGDVVWAATVDETADGGLSARSGAIGDGNETWLKVTFAGTGVLSFRCKTSCEHDDSGDFEWDSLRVYVDNVERTDWRVDGESGWIAERSIEFTTTGEHSVKWVYHKDEEPDSTDGEDCAWVDKVIWTPKQVSPVVNIDKDKMAEPEIDEESGTRTIAVKGDPLEDEAEIAALVEQVTVSVMVGAEQVYTTAGYNKTYDPASNTIVITLKEPEVGAEATTAEETKVEGDATGMLAEVNDENVELATEAPTPTEEEEAAGTIEVSALPVKAVKGLYYQASWGSDLSNLRQGEKVQATGETIYLGVIKQQGIQGFYKVTVSEQ